MKLGWFLLAANAVAVLMNLACVVGNSIAGNTGWAFVNGAGAIVSLLATWLCVAGIRRRHHRAEA